MYNTPRVDKGCLFLFLFSLSVYIWNNRVLARGYSKYNQREKKGKEIKHPLSTRGVFSIEYTDVEIKICSFSYCEYTQQKM